MSIPLLINGTTWTYPQTGDTNWGVQATGWANAVTVGMLQRAGGAFTLTAEVDFGATYGLMAAYYKSKGTNISLTGVTRLARTESIGWRNQANSADLLLGVDASDVLTFNGEVIPAGLIVNADISASAAIAFSKMAALTASRALVSDGSGVVTVSAATATEVGYLSGVTSAIQTQLTARLPLAGGTMTGNLFLNADPTSSTQAATKQYVDNAAAGSTNNFTVRVATTAAVNLANELEDGDTLDGETLATGDLVLVKNQAATEDNGIYVVPASGAASRSSGMDNWTEAIGATVFVTEGSVNVGTQWKFNTAAGGTLGVTAIPIVQFGASQVYTADGEGIELTGSQFGLELDGTTLSKSGTGLKVNEIANAQIAAGAAIAVNKLAALTASRAVVSDGSGFLTQATTTATEIGFINGLTSSAQTQLDAKIAASVMTTNGDLITRAAGVPARIAIGTSGYYLGSNGTAAAWTDPKISYAAKRMSADPSETFPTTWTALNFSLAGNDLTPVNGPTFSATQLSAFPYADPYKLILCFGGVSGSAGRSIGVRVWNATDGTFVTSAATGGAASTTATISQTFVLLFTPNVSKAYEIQICATGSGVTMNSVTINSQAMATWTLWLERIR